MDSVSKGFTITYAAEWRRSRAKAVGFAVLFPLVPIGILAALLSIGGYNAFKMFALVLVAIFTIVFCLQGIVVASSAPQVLATVALGIIDRLDLAVLVFYPVLRETLSERPNFKWTFRAGVDGEKLNTSLTERIRWASSEMFPKTLPGAIAPDEPESKSLPVSLTNPSLPLTSSAGCVLTNWRLLLLTAVPGYACVCGGLNPFDPFTHSALVFADAHRLAYSAAYYKAFTDKWPWEAR